MSIQAKATTTTTPQSITADLPVLPTSPLLPLRAAVQNYAWGKPAASSLVAYLHAANARLSLADPTQPFAELWIGTHPAAPAIVPSDSSRGLPTPLDAVLRSRKAPFPSLPFLLKVLSVNCALSIQAHPDKSLAAELHRAKPHLYKDDNHKPEMSVALTPFEALCNFRPLTHIVDELDRVPELLRLLTPTVASFIRAAASPSAPSADKKAALKQFFSALITAPQDTLAHAFAALTARLSSTRDALPPTDALFLRLHTQYPGDVGCLAAYFLNYISLTPGQAFFMAANEPHAYLSGDCVEIMACSDNVVRAGLTPKPKDEDTLLQMLTYNDQPPNIMPGTQIHPHVKAYQPPPFINEFQLERVSLPQDETLDLRPARGPSLLLAVAGQGWVTVRGAEHAENELSPLAPGSIYYVDPGAVIALQALPGTEDQRLVVFRAGVNETSSDLQIA